MREKNRKVLFTFPTTTQALSMDHHAKACGEAGRLIPVPSQVRAGCGMAWCAPIEDRGVLEGIISREGIEVEEIYELLL